MTETPHLIRSARSRDVLTIVLNDPERGNAMGVALTLQLAAALEAAHQDATLRCVVIRGSGKHFCTGGNVKDMRDGSDLMEGSPTEVCERLRGSLHRVTRAMQALEIPVIAGINGLAIGAGCDLALMCDIRVAGDRAKLAESFLRLGLVSGIGGAWFLTRLVGPAKAMEMTLTSEFIDAAEALRLGLVSRVVPQDRLDAEVGELAHRIASAPPRATRMAKRLVRESASSTLPAALEMAAAMQAILLGGDEHKQAVAAFLESQAA